LRQNWGDYPLGATMFVTMPQFEEPGMTAKAGEGQKYWRALAAVFPADPWYLFVFEAALLDARINQTMLVAWEESLLDIIERVPAEDRRAVYRLEPGAAGGLTLRTVQALWAPTAEEAAQGVGAVLGIEGESDLLDPRLHPVSRTHLRRLVFQMTQEGRHATTAYFPATH
jgi:hypothetical protein